MNFPADRRALVAVDLGAQSCRVSLLRWLPEGPHIQLVYRVANAPILRDGQLRWDLSALCATADEGLRRCAAIANEGIAAIGVTGWAVDYVRLDNAGHPIADPFCYRDARNAKAMEALHRRISPARLYKITGIQVLVINTLYQLYADNIDGISPDLRWLNLPEYMLYRWGARPIAEYTNATHSAMMELGTSQWSQQIFSAAGLDISAAPQIVAPGSVVGHLQGPLAQLPALRDTRLIAPACHDTASAVAGISAAGDDWAFLSSGTWSLLGTLSHHPCAGPDAAQWNFTNEGAVGGNFCFLRNINGMWLLQQCLESWNTSGHQLDIKTLMQAAETMPEPKHLLDVDDPDLLHPDNMPQRILECMERQHPHTSRDIDQSPAAIANLILHSLAARYASVLRQAEMITGKNFSRLYVVGGGSRNRLLNRLTQQATGLELICGSSESSTDGNFSVQLAALENVDRDVAGVSHANVAQWASLLSLNSMSSDAVFSSAASPQAAATMPTECPGGTSTMNIDHHAQSAPETDLWRKLDNFTVEVPSWGFANTGTRFGKYLQPSAAHTLEEKFADAAQIHRLSGASPSMALHVLWDLPHGVKDVPKVRELAGQYGIRAGAINPNMFENQEYKHGSFGNPDPEVRKLAVDHVLESVAIARELGNVDLSFWFADGSNYPGTQNIRHRIDWFTACLQQTHAALAPGQRMLVEYKPFEPAFYHTDIADWGMALLLAQAAGPQALVLVDTGHHYQAQNIEQILAWLQHRSMLGGLHFNDRRYADDDLTLGSIDPYQVFRIFHEILFHAWENPKAPAPAYVIDQSHNLKNKMEAMLQTVLVAQELYSKASLVDHARLATLQQECRLVEAEECLRAAFWTDVRPMLRAWRAARGLPADPLQALRDSGYIERISRERSSHNKAIASTYA